MRVSQGSGWLFLWQTELCIMKELNSIDWQGVNTSLNEKGFYQISSLISAAECKTLVDLYDAPLYRSIINMERYRFGRGEYKYFNYPLPNVIQMLREQLYPYLAEVANAWAATLGDTTQYPPAHGDFIAVCHQKDQQRPTPLILRYDQGGYNTLHQDLYGEIYFPFQVVIILSQEGKDFDGGELVMTEQLPRAQSKATVLTPQQGDAVIFTTNFRPVKGTKGYYRSRMRHGISEIKSGRRHALGIIFHDAL